MQVFVFRLWLSFPESSTRILIVMSQLWGCAAAAMPARVIGKRIRDREGQSVWGLSCVMTDLPSVILLSVAVIVWSGAWHRAPAEQIQRSQNSQIFQVSLVHLNWNGLSQFWAAAGSLFPTQLSQTTSYFSVNSDLRHKVTVLRGEFQGCAWRFWDRDYCGSKRCYKNLQSCDLPLLQVILVKGR